MENESTLFRPKTSRRDRHKKKLSTFTTSATAIMMPSVTAEQKISMENESTLVRPNTLNEPTVPALKFPPIATSWVAQGDTPREQGATAREIAAYDFQRREEGQKDKKSGFVERFRQEINSSAIGERKLDTPRSFPEAIDTTARLVRPVAQRASRSLSSNPHAFVSHPAALRLSSQRRLSVLATAGAETADQLDSTRTRYSFSSKK